MSAGAALLTCPGCGAQLTWEVAVAHETSRELMVRALRLPRELARIVPSYIALFRPPQRQLTWARFAPLLDELVTAIDAAQIERRGRVWPAPLDYWRVALETVLAARDQGRLALPLKSHGYLYEVLVGLSDAAERQQEAQREERAAYRYARSASEGATGAAQSVAQIVERGQMSEDSRAALDALKRRHRHALASAEPSDAGPA